MEQKKQKPEFFVMLKDGRWVGKSSEFVDIVYPDGLHIICHPLGDVAVIKEVQDWIVYVKDGRASYEKLSVFNQWTIKERAVFFKKTFF